MTVRAAFWATLFCAIGLSCDKPDDAPYQSPRDVLGLPRWDTVKAGGSDPQSAALESEHLKWLVETASASFHEDRIARDFTNLALDPRRLELVEKSPVRVYFIGEASGAINALGINLEGIGINAGDPQILFPNASCTVGLHQSKRHFEEDGLNREAFGDRVEEAPLQPGDFVDLGTHTAGTSLEFFLVSTAGVPDLETYTAHPERNHDGLQHMVAVVQEEAGILLLSFEDLPNLGDKDFGDCVFAVQLSTYNLEALLGRIDPWRRAKQVGLVVGVVALVVCGPTAFAAWRRHTRRRRARQARSEAARIAAKDLESAIGRVERALDSPMDKQSRSELTALQCTLFESAQDGASLAGMLDSDADSVYAREPASLMAARAVLTGEDLESYNAVRDRWRETGEAERAWHELDFDAALARDEAASVVAECASGTFASREDAGVLARLALAELLTDTDRAFAHANQAVQLAPDNADALVARGIVLEGIGNLDEAASSIQAALKLAPHDPAVRLRAGGFYRRRRAYAKAIEIWSAGLRRPSHEELWLQTLFWRKVAAPVPLPLTGLTPPAGKMRPLIDFIRELPDTRFWDETAFEPLAAAHPALSGRQEVFWLSVLERLRNRDEKTAHYLLNTQRFGPKSWCPALESALLLIASYRATGFMDPRAAGDTPDVPGDGFFAQLNAWACGDAEPSGTLQRAVTGETAYATACRAAGWQRAAQLLGLGT